MENNDLFGMVKGGTKKHSQQMPLGVALNENYRPMWEQKVFSGDLFFNREYLESLDYVILKFVGS